MAKASGKNTGARNTKSRGSSRTGTSSRRTSSSKSGRSRRMTEQDYARERREARHRRRVRSTALCWLLLVVMIVMAVIGIIFAGHKISDLVAKKNAEKAEAQRIEQQKAAEEQAALEEAEASAKEEAEEEEAPEEYTEEDLLSDMIEACIDEMSFEDKAAGLFLTTPEVLTGVGQAIQAGDSTAEALGLIPVGGMVYHSSNIENENQFATMLTDTIDKSKYPLFLVFNDTSDLINAGAITEYGVNMDFGGHAETAGEKIEAKALPEGTGDGLSIAVIDGSAQDCADSMISAWKSGCDMFYVIKDMDSAFKGFLKAVESDEELKAKVRDSLEKIYRIKYSNRVGE